jgi:pimeloyl-ACP methyl ester carboxylesterase
LNRHIPPKLIPTLMSLKHRIDGIVEKRVPTMLIVGAEDALIAPQIMEIMAQRIPRARLLKVPGTGHSVYFERPEEFNRALIGFLQEQGVK